MKKYCPRCKTNVPVNHFHRNKYRGDGLAAYCKTCNGHYQKTWREASPIYRAAAKARQRRGVTQEQANQLLENQGGICPGCKSHNPGKHDWHVDHNHKTGKVRGVLCNNCNRALGHAKDNPEILLCLMEYLYANC